MVIHIISTVNGEENEGMRNIATHIARALEKKNRVVYSTLHDFTKYPNRCKQSDCTFIFARCISRLYEIIRFCSFFSKKIYVFVVQKPDDGFIKKCKKHPLQCSYFTVCKEDVASLCVRTGYRMFDLPVGINKEKFYPVSSEIKNKLKQKYGFETEKPLVIHVGHCSVGRGLEDFQYIDSASFQSMVVASGMFDNESVKSTLLNAGVKIHSGFLENINEIYQMADAYFFPTQNDDYVISIPLSVMEALSCGIPVLAYSSFGKLRNIHAVPGSISFINSKNEINNGLAKIVTMKHDASYLINPISWTEVSDMVYKIVNKGNGSYA